MTDLFLAAVVFACVMAGTLLGMWLRSKLPEHHLNKDSKEIVKLGIGLVGTIAALVLGLVTASAKTFFDEQNAAVKQGAADVLALDRLLARYGPETKEIRQEIQQAVVYRLRAAWPNDPSTRALNNTAAAPTIEDIDERIHTLMPANDLQKWLQSRAIETSDRLLNTRWLVLGTLSNTVPLPFLSVITVWVTIIFASFGLMAPRNLTVFVVLNVCALSVSAAIFLILEMSRPFEGVMTVSSGPIQYTIEQLGH